MKRQSDKRTDGEGWVPVGAQIGIASKLERGHSCPQQRPMGEMAWELARAGCLSRFAADRNVRAPVVVPKHALDHSSGLFGLDAPPAPRYPWACDRRFSSGRKDALWPWVAGGAGPSSGVRILHDFVFV
jgi:hypothetical protein